MTATRKILELNAFDMRAAAGLDPDVANLVARRRRVFGPTSMLFYARPLNLVLGDPGRSQDLSELGVRKKPIESSRHSYNAAKTRLGH